MPHATSSGSFVMRSLTHNQDGFTNACNNFTKPYPHYEGIYVHSNTHNLCDEEFTDLSLNNFLVAQRQVARQKLEHLQLTPYQGSFLFQGVQPHWEQWELYNVVLKASIGYAASCGVVVMDEVASLNERVDKDLVEMKEKTLMVMRRVVRATLPSALNMINASSVGKLVQLVTASRLTLYHKGRIDPMKDECHYQVKH